MKITQIALEPGIPALLRPAILFALTDDGRKFRREVAQEVNWTEIPPLRQEET